MTQEKFNAPATVFLNAVEDKLINGIPFEDTYKMYKAEDRINKAITYTDFIQACSVVFLSKLSTAKLNEHLMTHLAKIIDTVSEQAVKDYIDMKKEMRYGRQTNN